MNFSLIICPLVFVSVRLVVIAFPRRVFVDRFMAYRAEKLSAFEVMLKELFVPNMTAAELFNYYLGGIATTAVLVYLLTSSIVTTVIFVALAYYSPQIVFLVMKQRETTFQ